MNKFKAVVFDLDGTLLNSIADLGDAMNSTLTANNFPVHSYDEYKLFLGSGLKNLTLKSLPEEQRNDKTVGRLYEEMQITYKKNCTLKTRPYNGIPELLTSLTKKNIPFAILSNKEISFTQYIVNKLLSGWHFTHVLGSTVDIPKKPDPAGALIITKELNIKPEEFLYLGDTGIDMKTANAAKMHSVGVTWGFRSKEELIENGARTIIDTPSSLIKML